MASLSWSSSRASVACNRRRNVQPRRAPLCLAAPSSEAIAIGVPHLTNPRVVQITERQSAVVAGFNAPKPNYALTTSLATVSASETAQMPNALARLFLGAATAVSLVYALLTPPASPSTTAEATFPASSIPTPTPNAFPVISTANSEAAAMPYVAVVPVLKTQEAFDRFVLAANSAGCLVCVLFHAPWSHASRSMKQELERLSVLFAGRRLIFARVDCAVSSAGGHGGRLAQRCDMSTLHRIHRTPVVRMYHNTVCVDEVVGSRPVDFRQAISDSLFKYGL